MKYLFRDWEKIEKAIKRASHVLLLADYDGTLTPIVSRPQDAVLNSSIRDILRLLAKNKRFFIGVISGRSLSDIKRKIRLNNVYYAGNHGLQIEGPALSFVHPLWEKFRPYLLRIKSELYSKIKGIKGAMVEYKNGSISLHYRLVKERKIKKLKSIFKKVCIPYLNKKRIRISSGKKVLEVRPPIRWNKGSAAGRICDAVRASGQRERNPERSEGPRAKRRGDRRKKILVIYLGDDITDEDAFSFLKKKNSLTILVGRRKSSADYYLKSPSEVKKFLIRLCQT